MARKKNKALFVNSEMTPYLPESAMSSYCSCLTEKMQERRMEIRAFMPRYGLVNERKNQLHEVIRLSGMNLIVSDVDRPLIIKVASLPTSRTQVYFIDNEDFFHRKFLYAGNDGKWFEDNGERAVFFVRGVLETVKKLRWAPDIIHCNGWISHLLPVLLKKYYSENPFFAETKVVTTLLKDNLADDLGAKFAKAVLDSGLTAEDIAPFGEDPSGINLAKLALRYSDAAVFADDTVPQELKGFAAGLSLPVLEIRQNADIGAAYTDFYDSL